MLNQKSLMIISLLSTALIAFYLKTASNNHLILPDENSSSKIEIVLMSLNLTEESGADIFSIINSLDADLLVLQEYNQIWDEKINKTLIKSYPYAHMQKRNDNFGIAIYTRRKIYNIENFYFNDIPNIKVVVDNGSSKLTLLSSHLPAEYPTQDQNADSHLSILSEKIQSSRYPSIVIGDFNKMYWSNELIKFMKNSSLENSRRSISIENLNPDDHIFYTKRLECIGFQEITDLSNNHLGLKGTYQIK